MLSIKFNALNKLFLKKKIIYKIFKYKVFIMIEWNKFNNFYKNLIHAFQHFLISYIEKKEISNKKSIEIEILKFDLFSEKEDKFFEYLTKMKTNPDFKKIGSYKSVCNWLYIFLKNEKINDLSEINTELNKRFFDSLNCKTTGNSSIINQFYIFLNTKFTYRGKKIDLKIDRLKAKDNRHKNVLDLSSFLCIEEDVDNYISKTKLPNKYQAILMLKMMMYANLSVRDIMKLKFSDISITREYIVLNIHNQNRHIKKNKILGLFHNYIKETQKSEHENFFLSRTNKPYAERTVHQRIKACCNEIGIDLIGAKNLGKGYINYLFFCKVPKNEIIKRVGNVNYIEYNKKDVNE